MGPPFPYRVPAAQGTKHCQRKRPGWSGTTKSNCTTLVAPAGASAATPSSGNLTPRAGGVKEGPGPGLLGSSALITLPLTVIWLLIVPLTSEKYGLRNPDEPSCWLIVMCTTAPAGTLR